MNKTTEIIMSIDIVAVTVLDALLVQQAIAYQTIGSGLNPLVALPIGAILTIATIMLVINNFRG
jgi:hypothetical protein